jgi:hypothetical protein
VSNAALPACLAVVALLMVTTAMAEDNSDNLVRLHRSRRCEGVADGQRWRDGRRLRRQVQDHRQEDDGVLRHAVAENNGGFASVRSKAKKLGLEKGDTLVAKSAGRWAGVYALTFYPNKQRLTALLVPGHGADHKQDEWIEIQSPARRVSKRLHLAAWFRDAGAVKPAEVQRRRLPPWATRRQDRSRLESRVDQGGTNTIRHFRAFRCGNLMSHTFIRGTTVLSPPSTAIVCPVIQLFSESSRPCNRFCVVVWFTRTSRGVHLS